MNVRHHLFNLARWLVTVSLQVMAAYLVVFVISILWGLSKVNAITQVGWIFIIALVWLGFSLGIGMVGWLRLRKSQSPVSLIQRLVASALAGLMPVAILLVMGLQLDFSDQLQFEAIITKHYQPRLLDVSLLLGILGFYLPGWLRTYQIKNSL